MAIEVEKLMVTLEARIDQYEKALDKASDGTNAKLAEIEARFKKLESAVAASSAKAGRGFESVAKSVKSTEVQVGNLAAQFNDIGVQLAGGQSPFLIALQQGSQITQAFGGAGVKGALVGVGGALASLVSPLSLFTIGIIAAGGYAVQYFASLIGSGETSEETLEKQAQLIDAVAAKWGDAYPAIKAYNDEIKRAKDQAQLLSTIELIKQDKLKSIPDILDQLNIEMADFISQLRLAGEEDEQIIDLQSAINGAAEKMRDGKDASAELTTAMDILKSGIENTANPAVQSMINLLGELMGVSQRTASAVASVVNSAAKVQEQLQNTIQAATFRDKDGNIRYTSEFEPIGDAATPTKRDPIELEGLPKTPGGGTKADPYKDATRSLTERTAALEAQRTAQAGLNPLINDYGYALEFAKARQDLLTAAQKGGKEVTPQLAAEIDRLAGAYASTSAEIQKMAESSKNAAASIQFQKDLVNGALSDMRTALEDGKLTWEDLGNVAVNVLNKIADRLQSMLVDQLFAKGFGGLFGSLVGGVSGVGGIGAVGAGGIGAGALASSAAAKAPSFQSIAKSQSVAVDVKTYVDETGNWQAKVEKISGGVAAKTMNVGLRKYRDNQLHEDISSHLRQPRRRGSI